MKRLLILAFFISCTSHAAGIKKWTDEQGQVHYGDTPPVKTPSESIRVSRPPSDPGKPLPRLSDSNDEAQNDTAAQQPQQQQAPETTEEQASVICQKAREDLVKLRRSSRIRLKSDDGTVRYMSAEEIEQRKQQTEEDIQQFCKE